MKKGPEENGFVKTPNSLLRRILEKDSDYTHVAMYLSSRARFSFEESNDGLKRGQLRTSKRQIAEECRIKPTKVFRILQFLKEIGFIIWQISRTGKRIDSMVITLPFYDIGEKKPGPRITPGKDKESGPRVDHGTDHGIGPRNSPRKTEKVDHGIGPRNGPPNKIREKREKGLRGEIRGESRGERRTPSIPHKAGDSEISPSSLSQKTKEPEISEKNFTKEINAIISSLAKEKSATLPAGENNFKKVLSSLSKEPAKKTKKKRKKSTGMKPHARTSLMEL